MEHPGSIRPGNVLTHNSPGKLPEGPTSPAWPLLCNYSSDLDLSSPEREQCLLLGDTGEYGGRDRGGLSLSPSPSGAGSAGEGFLSTIQKAAEVVANAVRPGPESPSTQRSLPRGDAYQPAMTPSAGHGGLAAGKPLSGARPGARGSGETLLGGLAFPCQGLGERPLPVLCSGERGQRGARGKTPLVARAPGSRLREAAVERRGRKAVCPAWGQGAPLCWSCHDSEAACYPMLPWLGGAPTEPATALARVYWGLCGGFLVIRR